MQFFFNGYALEDLDTNQMNEYLVPPSRPIRASFIKENKKTKIKIKNLLKKSKFHFVESLKGGFSESIPIKVKIDGLDCFFVLKPCNNRPFDNINESCLELAAYFLSNYFNFYVIPYLFYLEDFTLLHNGISYKKKDAIVMPYYENYNIQPKLEDIEILAAFDFIIQNEDRNSNNFIVSNSGSIIGIDHGRAFLAQEGYIWRTLTHFPKHRFIKNDIKKKLENFNFNVLSSNKWLIKLGKSKLDSLIDRIILLNQYLSLEKNFSNLVPVTNLNLKLGRTRETQGLISEEFDDSKEYWKISKHSNNMQVGFQLTNVLQLFKRSDFLELIIDSREVTAHAEPSIHAYVGSVYIGKILIINKNFDCNHLRLDLRKSKEDIDISANFIKLIFDNIDDESSYNVLNVRLIKFYDT